MARILILFDSRGGQTEHLAEAVGQGVREIPDAEPLLRRVHESEPSELLTCDALILGSPNWSGISGNLKERLDDLGDLWAEGVLTDKIGAAFTAGTSRHSGIEFTLLSIIHWLLSGGMLIAGLPWEEAMRLSGSYYGVTATGTVEEADRRQAARLGRRVAALAKR